VVAMMMMLMKMAMPVTTSTGWLQYRGTIRNQPFVHSPGDAMHRSIQYLVSRWSSRHRHCQEFLLDEA